MWLDGWISVDPYLGQVPADISHLRLANKGADGLSEWDAKDYAGLDRLRLTVILPDEAEVEGAATP